jgi:hypothetical protein
MRVQQPGHANAEQSARGVRAGHGCYGSILYPGGESIGVASPVNERSRSRSGFERYRLVVAGARGARSGRMHRHALGLAVPQRVEPAGVRTRGAFA